MLGEISVTPKNLPFRFNFQSVAFTNRYTLENWRNDEDPVIKQIPPEVKEITLEEAYHNLGSGDQNIVEIIFQYIFDREGWTVERMPIKDNNWVNRVYKHVMTEKFDSVTWDALSERSGIPDFLLRDMKNEKYRFVEIKASEDKLRPSQKDWANNYQKTNFYVAKLAPIGILGKNPSDREIIEENKL